MLCIRMMNKRRHKSKISKLIRIKNKYFRYSDIQIERVHRVLRYRVIQKMTSRSQILNEYTNENKSYFTWIISIETNGRMILRILKIAFI